jgi:hypothetical protein
VTTLGPADERLLALLAVFAPDRASAFAALISSADTGALVEEAARAARSPRAERLSALAACAGGLTGKTARGEVLEALASAERPRTAAALRAAGTRGASERLGAAILDRLLRERLEPLEG